ncbi:MAG TPA: hypothetical protein PLE33_04710 [Candidatus Cloacimonas sp.]|nr:hypothetical protein [Candidatus Cloacimonas sp.]HPS60544.1 hypothetical protein [Candidatus Cloacimonas sp.]
MPLFSHKQLLNLKLSSIKSENLKELAVNLGISPKGSTSEITKRILEMQPLPPENIIDAFIKTLYLQKIQERKELISDADLRNEVSKVKNFAWSTTQGGLDQKIQKEFVRRYCHYDDLINHVKLTLHDDVTNYAICSWYNHWTTVYIEEHIGAHPKVIPTIKNIKGIDLFFAGQPFDLKITYIPKEYNIANALQNPLDLAVWMYENQGAERFGADNRIFIILLDKENPAKSWELKRNFELIFRAIDAFFTNDNVSAQDEIAFTYHKKSYTTIAKVLMITK